MQMCSQPDRHFFSTRLTFLSAGQPEGCFADPPTRFRLMVSADNPHFGKRQNGISRFWTFPQSDLFLRLGLATSFSLVRFFDTFWAWAVLTPSLRVIQGRGTVF